MMLKDKKAIIDERLSGLILGQKDSSTGYGKTTYEWHTDDIRVHTSDIRMTYEYIRAKYGWHASTQEWHTSTYKWHTRDIQKHVSDIQMTCGSKEK